MNPLYCTHPSLRSENDINGNQFSCIVLLYKTFKVPDTENLPPLWYIKESHIFPESFLITGDIARATDRKPSSPFSLFIFKYRFPSAAPMLTPNISDPPIFHPVFPFNCSKVQTVSSASKLSAKGSPNKPGASPSPAFTFNRIMPSSSSRIFSKPTRAEMPFEEIAAGTVRAVNSRTTFLPGKGHSELFPLP